MNFEADGQADAQPDAGGMPDNPFADGQAGGDTGGGGMTPSGGITSRLFDGSAPGPSVGELQTDYGLEQDQSILARGIVRVGTGGGIPPIMEIIGGSVMWAVRARNGDSVDVSGTTEAVEHAGPTGEGDPGGSVDPGLDGEP